MINTKFVAIILGTVSLAALVPLTSVLAQAPQTLGSGLQNSQPHPSLTPEQKAQIQQLRASAQQQVLAVLTATQRSQYQAAIAQGKSPREAMQGLTLTPEQQTQIRQIRETTFRQIQAIAPDLGKHRRKGYPKGNLTDAQRNQMRELHQSTRQQIEAMLTPAQRSQYQAAISQGQKPKQAMAALGLSDGQKAQIQQILQNARVQKQKIISAQ